MTLKVKVKVKFTYSLCYGLKRKLLNQLFIIDVHSWHTDFICCEVDY